MNTTTNATSSVHRQPPITSVVGTSHSRRQTTLLEQQPHGGSEDDAFESLACQRIAQNGVGEKLLFRNGMSIADLMHAYTTQHKFTDVDDWDKKTGDQPGQPQPNVGFCMHSDWVWGYFLNYYHVAWNEPSSSLSSSSSSGNHNPPEKDEPQQKQPEHEEHKDDDSISSLLLTRAALEYRLMGYNHSQFHPKDSSQLGQCLNSPDFQPSSSSSTTAAKSKRRNGKARRRWHPKTIPPNHHRAGGDSAAAILFQSQNHQLKNQSQYQRVQQNHTLHSAQLQQQQQRRRQQQRRQQQQPPTGTETKSVAASPMTGDAYCNVHAHFCHRITANHMRFLHQQQQQQQRMMIMTAAHPNASDA
ncbi:hypothetical protein ACA910_019217 [Epithemia clementina (nom. ined.)]